MIPLLESSTRVSSADVNEQFTEHELMTFGADTTLRSVVKHYLNTCIQEASFVDFHTAPRQTLGRLFSIEVFRNECPSLYSALRESIAVSDQRSIVQGLRTISVRLELMTMLWNGNTSRHQAIKNLLRTYPEVVYESSVQSELEEMQTVLMSTTISGRLKIPSPEKEKAIDESCEEVLSRYRQKALQLLSAKASSE